MVKTQTNSFSYSTQYNRRFINSTHSIPGFPSRISLSFQFECPSDLMDYRMTGTLMWMPVAASWNLLALLRWNTEHHNRCGYLTDWGFPVATEGGPVWRKKKPAHWQFNWKSRGCYCPWGWQTKSPKTFGDKSQRTIALTKLLNLKEFLLFHV